MSYMKQNKKYKQTLEVLLQPKKKQFFFFFGFQNYVNLTLTDPSFKF